MSRPPVTYPATLADLVLFADAAAELDKLKNTITSAAELASVCDLIDRLHETIDRLAGADAGLVYGPDDDAEVAA